MYPQQAPGHTPLWVCLWHWTPRQPHSFPFSLLLTWSFKKASILENAWKHETFQLLEAAEHSHVKDTADAFFLYLELSGQKQALHAY